MFSRCLLFSLTGLLLASSVYAVQRPVASVEDHGSASVLRVGGVEVRRSAREITGTMVGTDPAGTATFVTWEESGERWGSHSRNSGESWSTPRPVRQTLKLRDGDTRPGDPMPAPLPDLQQPAAGRLYLVQLKTVSLPEWRSALEAHGAELIGYMPHNAHIVRLDAERADEIVELEFVERVEPFHPSYRIEPGLRSQLSSGQIPIGTVRVRVMVAEWGPIAKTRVLERAARIGARIAEYWPSGHVVEFWADRDQLIDLAGHDDVVWIERWTRSESDMDLVREDSGSNWAGDTFGYCGQGVRGEVMDGGIQDDHPDFDGLLTHGPYGVDSHGVATYGIVFGNGDIDGDGDGRAIGHLPCGQGIFAAYPELNDRFVHTQELKQAPYFASFQTNSWGAVQTQSYTTVSQEMDDIIWRLDIAILNSQSNTGNQLSRPEAWAKNVISVGGITHHETLDTADDEWNGSASIGPAADGRIKPDVSYWNDSIFTTSTGSGYTETFGGTSAATPETAGVLGLLVEMWADNVWRTDPTGITTFDRQPHASTIKALLINSSRQYDFVGAGSDLGRFKQGWGRPSARVAYERAASSFVIDETTSLELDDTAAYSIDVAPGESELRVTMIYPDPPGTTSSSMHRINDLDLRVISPSATTYLGNAGLEDGTESAAGGTPDTLNTVENIFITNPQAGTWTVEVDAVEVNQDAHLDTPATDDVAFALVVTGGRAQASSGAGRFHVSKTEIACSDTIELTVIDANASSGSLSVEVSSNTESNPEIVTLSETNPGSGNYIGTIGTAPIAPAADGLIAVNEGDTVTFDYVDADDDQGGVDLLLRRTAAVDCAGPQISNVWVSDLTDTEANISWVTSEPSNSTLIWGATPTPVSSETRAGSVTAHNVRLTGLAECTSYFFSVSSSDPRGNVSTDDNGGGFYLLTTLTRTEGQLHSCREGTLVLEADRVGCAGNVPIRLTDADLNLNPGLAESVEVTLSSTTELTPETVLLTEGSPNSGVFTGFLPTGLGPASTADGVLQLADGDWITGLYRDADDGTGSSRNSLYTIDADCAPPDISPVWITNITNSGARVNWSTSEPSTGFVEWGPTPALGSSAPSGASQTSHGVDIAGFDSCEQIYVRITAADASGNVGVSDSGGTTSDFHAWGVPGIFAEDDFETDSGWSLAGEWEIDQPQGLGSAPGDPAAAYSGTQLLGHDLSGLGTEIGDFEPLSSETATSPVIDGTAFVNTEIGLWRRLNVTQGSFAYIDVRDSGGTWRLAYQTLVAGVQDSDWVRMTFDVSAHADGNSNLQIRFRERSFIASSFASGWNVDDLSFRDGSQPQTTACGGCVGAPSFAGLVSVIDDDPCADSGVTLSWSAAAAWGTGVGGSYAVYRDSQPGFTPGPGNLLASGLTVTEWTDTTAPDDVDQFYLVRAENDEACSNGPTNNGVMDSGTVYVTARDATSQPAPGDVGNTVRVDSINRAHARVSWADPGAAAVYTVYRSDRPDLNFAAHAASTATRFDDRDVFDDGQTWYYLVRAADSCGNEGP